MSLPHFFRAAPFGFRIQAPTPSVRREPGEIDARTAPVQIDAKLADLGIHDKAVVQLDLAHSIIPVTAEKRLLLPSLSIAS